MSETEILTFGCRLNANESEAMLAHARAACLTDTVIVNTCAVTAEAVRQSRQAIRKLRRERPNARIVVTGCAAQTDPDLYARMPEVDRVIGNIEKLSAATYQNGFLESCPRVVVNDIMAVKETAAEFLSTAADVFASKTRAVLQVQNGCDHRCTFCIIPYGRGNSRSVGMGAVVDEARRLVELGFKEIVLSGVDLTAYGADLPGTPGLGALIARILKHVPELKRLRLSSIDSIEVDEILLKLIAEEERLMPHFHLSLQSGSDLILKRMKRRHGRADAIGFCEAARRLRPDVSFGADLIAGFPTETEAMFGDTLSLVDECGLSHLHVFPFSARPGTPAAKMPQVPGSIGKERAKRLRDKGEKAFAAELSAHVGSEQEFLVEKPGMGRARSFAPAIVPGRFLPGTLIRAIVEATDGRMLKAGFQSLAAGEIDRAVA